MANFTFTDSPKVDGVHWPLALYHNEYEAAIEKLSMGAALAAFVDSQTIAATLELTDANAPVMVITPSGADRTVELAPEATSNHQVVIINAGSTYNVIVKDDSGGSFIDLLRPGQVGVYISTGSAWIAATGRRGYVDEQGGKLTYVGAAEYAVTPGAAMVNSEVLSWAANISRSGLSLSATTLYYLYLYNNSGAPAVEESATAPVWSAANQYYGKGADTSRRCIGWIATNASGNIRNFIRRYFRDK
jgi:hypothetical protein